MLGEAHSIALVNTFESQAIALLCCLLHVTIVHTNKDTSTVVLRVRRRARLRGMCACIFYTRGRTVRKKGSDP